MLDINKSQFVETLSLDVHSSVIALEEGSALVHVMENGRGKVQASAGTQYEVFAGAAVSRATTPTVAPITETLNVPGASAYTVNLSRTPAGTIGVIAIAPNGTRTVLAAAGAASTTEYARSGKVITLHSSFAGYTVKVTYTYTLTHAEAVLKFNFDAFASVNLAMVPVIGVLTVGIFYTSKYDPTVDWDAFGGANTIRLGADGNFTIASSGNATVVPGYVIEAPSANSNGFLGLRIYV